MLTTYRQLGRQIDERMLPSESILHYLQNSPEYFGISFSPERFKQFNANGQPIQEYVEKENKYKTVYQQDRPLCFDYQMIREKKLMQKRKHFRSDAEKRCSICRILCIADYQADR